MPQNFTSQDLRGKSFKGQDLTGANFSNADIRGADFSNAILTDANFSGVKAGMRSLPLMRFAAISLLILATILVIFVKNYLFVPTPADLEYTDEGWQVYWYPAMMAGAAPGAIATVWGAFLVNRIAPGTQSAKTKIGRDRFTLKRLVNIEIIAALIGMALSAIALKDIAIIYVISWGFDSFFYHPGFGAWLGTMIAALGILVGIGIFTTTEAKINKWRNHQTLWVLFLLTVCLTLVLPTILVRDANVILQRGPFSTMVFFLFPLLFPYLIISPETSGETAFYTSESLIGLYVGCAFAVLFSVLYGAIAGRVGRDDLMMLRLASCFFVFISICTLFVILYNLSSIDRIYWIAILFMPACYSYVITFASDRTSFYKANLRNTDFSGAKLEHADFKAAIIEDTNFSRAKL